MKGTNEVRQVVRAGHVAWLCAGLLGLGGCLGPPPPPAPEVPADVGGLKAEDFAQISQNGFDPADNLVDRNDYAWSMEYFQPTGDAPAYVYVGTGNDVIGVVNHSARAFIGIESQQPYESRPPEIRRFREDLAPPTWETVLDYRDLEPGPTYSTIGFRFLRQYQSPTDATNYLYAGSYGNSAVLWRSASGDPGSWEVVWEFEEFGSFRYFEEHNGLLYITFTNEIPAVVRAGRIFVFDGKEVTPVITDGFGNPDNVDITCLASFNGWLYAGTKNEATGYEVWKLAGPDGQSAPVKVVDRGGPSPLNVVALTPCVYQGQLYIGNMLNPMSNLVSGLKAADIIRIDPDNTWETVVGPGALSGYDSGFDAWPNVYIWAMVEHDGWLYASTYDQISPYFNAIDNTPRMLKSLLRLRVANPIELIWRAGADLYKTQDGVTWYPVTLDGFGDVGNYGFRTMESVGEHLYIGTANPFDGLEVWRGHGPD
jgi:hypothetical protein